MDFRFYVSVYAGVDLVTEDLLLRFDLQLFAEQDSGDKTEEPTPKKRADARKKGQVNKSMEVNTAVGILGMMFLFLLLSGYVYDAFAGLFFTYHQTMFLQPVSEMDIGFLTNELSMQFFRLTWPVLGVAVLLGLISNLAQVGFLFTGEPLVPKLEKINPIEGFKRIFSRKSLFDLVKSLLKIAIIGTVSFLFLRSRFDSMLLLLNEEVAISAKLFWDTMVLLGLIVGLVYILLAALDFIYQRYEFEKKLKMSLRDIKDERKQMEGDPHIRAKIRRDQMEIARKRMLQDVPSADVVITNPTEIAVALRYVQSENSAPVLLAKGVEKIAEQIREIAREHDVPVVENPPVARMIWKETEVGEEIPVELYQVVAEILAMVYNIKDKKSI